MLLCPVGAGNEEGGDPPGRSCLKPWWSWNIVAMKTLKHHIWGLTGLPTWHDSLVWLQQNLKTTNIFHRLQKIFRFKFSHTKNLFNVFLLAPSHHLYCLNLTLGYLSFLDILDDSNRSGLQECILPQTNWWSPPFRFLIVTTTEQLISKRGGKIASHACPPHLRKLLSAHFVFYILHILADCCTDSVSHYFFVDWNQLASPSPSPFLASAKCFVSSNNWALCIFGCQPSAVSSGCLSPQKLRGKWSLRPGTDPVTTLPTEDLKMLTGVSRGKSDFSLESAQWGALLVSCVTEKSKLF